MPTAPPRTWRQRIARAEQLHDLCQTELLRLTAAGVAPRTAALLARQPAARAAGARAAIAHGRYSRLVFSALTDVTDAEAKRELGRVS